MKHLKMTATLTLAMTAGLAAGQEAPLFDRPFNGVPVAREEGFTRIIPVDPFRGGTLTRVVDPGDLADRFSETTVTPANYDMTAGFGYFGQFIDHDLDLSLESDTDFLLPPFVKALDLHDGEYTNERTPGFDLDSVYGFGPLEGVSSSEGWYDFGTGVGLRFRFGTGLTGAIDYVRDGITGRALIGDPRNDENGLVGQIHRGFQQLHNKKIDEILERDSIDEMTLTPGSPAWWDVFNEARNFTTAYYQGIVMNDFMPRLTGRSLFDALADTEHPIGALPEGPQIPLEFAQGAYRLHTIIPNEVQIGSVDFVSPIDPILRSTVHWGYLFGNRAAPASMVDTKVPAELRDIVTLVIPGTGEVNLDLGEVNILRGRETTVPSGEEYLAYLQSELGVGPTDDIRGKEVMTSVNAGAIFTSPDDADMMSDITAGDTDLWVYIMAEASVNGGELGPVGQDILERTFLNLMLSDDWSLIGANSGQFTQAQLDVFEKATIDGLIDIIYTPGDLNNDDKVNSDDLGMFLANWGTDDLASDINGDGVVESTDLGTLLVNWND